MEEDKTGGCSKAIIRVDTFVVVLLVESWS